MQSATLTFISGAHEGRTFTLPHNREVRLGRDQRADISIPEDLISRHHAKIYVGVVTTVHDLGSRNGTFVNGRRISSVELATGDRIAFGGSVVEVALPSPAANTGERTMSTASMAGSLAEIALPDMLQMLQVSRKSGVLSLATDGLQGEIEVCEGDVVDARLGQGSNATGIKAVCRLLTWRTGVFELRATPAVMTPPPALCGSTQGLLMEAFRQQDEFERLQEELGDLHRPLSLGPNRSPLSEPLKSALQGMIRTQNPTIAQCLNTLDATDLEIAQAIIAMRARGSITAP